MSKELLINNINECINEGVKTLNSLNCINGKDLHLYYLNLNLFNISFSVYIFYNRIKFLKQYSYITGVLYNSLVNKYNYEINLNVVTSILISDNIKIINCFSFIKHTSNYKGEFNIINCIQAVIRNDFIFLKKELLFIKNNIILKSNGKWVIPDYDFFMGILEKDIKKIENSIVVLATKKHIFRNRENIIIRDYISIPALTYAKLAWLKGIEVEIDSPLVPKELLPIKPNKEYWEYDFMKLDEFKCN